MNANLLKNGGIINLIGNMRDFLVTNLSKTLIGEEFFWFCWIEIIIERAERFKLFSLFLWK